MSDDRYDPPTKEGRCVLYARDGQYHAVLDRDGVVGLRHDLDWLAHCNRFGEEVNLASDPRSRTPAGAELIGYCEFNLGPSHLKKKIGKNIQKVLHAVHHMRQGVYQPQIGRLDYFVSAEELTAACETLTELLDEANGDCPPRRVMLFGTLVVHLTTK
jgi:hypothetical protein